MQGKSRGQGATEVPGREPKLAGDIPISRKSGTLTGMPPTMQKTLSARAGKGVVEETPIILDPAVAVSIDGKRDSAETTALADDILMMETAELRTFIRSSRCVGREDFSTEQFASNVSFSRPKSETSRGARYAHITSEDGNSWRIYPHIDALASIEKLEKCRFVAMLVSEGRHYHLYWETPELGRGH